MMVMMITLFTSQISSVAQVLQCLSNISSPHSILFLNVCSAHTGAMTRPSFALHNAFSLLVVVVVIVWLLNATVPGESEWLKILLDCQLA